MDAPVPTPPGEEPPSRLLALLKVVPFVTFVGLMITFGKRGGSVRNAHGGWLENLGACVVIPLIIGSVVLLGVGLAELAGQRIKLWRR